MSFPFDPLPMKSELFIGDEWVDLTAMGRVRNDADVVITRGRANEQANRSNAACSLTINNRDGMFSNRNPLSPYYGLLRRNVPFRQSVTESTPWAEFPNWLYEVNLSDGNFTTGNTSGIFTADKSVLDITGDLDVRADVEPNDWVTGSTMSVALAHKWDSIINQRSWVFYVSPLGELGFAWSSAGSAVTGNVVSTVPLDTSITRQSVRAVIDVNNGAAGRTIRFYTSDSVTGTWTQLGADVVQAGTTSIYSSTAALMVGHFDSTEVDPDEIYPFVGRYHRFQLRNGIAGTLVADMNAMSRTPGDTSWSDGLGTPNTWDGAYGGDFGYPEVTVDDYRFFGESSQFPQEWDSTGTDVYVPFAAAGLGRRLGQGQSALKSPLYRYLSALNHRGYWSFEESSQATTVANEKPSGQPATISDVTLGYDDTFPASQGVARINSVDSRIRGFALPESSTGQAWILFHFKMDAAPVGTVSLMDFYVNGTARRINFGANSTNFVISAYAPDGSLIGTDTRAHSGNTDILSWTAVMLRVEDTGSGNYQVRSFWNTIDTDETTYVSTNVTGVGTVGPSGLWRIDATSGLVDASYSQIITGNDDFTILDWAYIRASQAFVGETVAGRILRVMAEEGYRGYVIGDPRTSEAMGRQPTATLQAILEECANLDGGMLFEPRNALGYVYRTRTALYRQKGPQIDYAAGELSGELRPTDDDQLIRNDVTVNRPLGSSARSVKETGTNSVEDVGRYDTTVQRNPETDGRLKYLAGHEVHLGTWDAQRFPVIQVEFARSAFLGAGLTKAKALARLDMADRFDLVNLPSWLPPDGVPLMVQGYREVLRNRGREFRWNTSPYGPYLQTSNLIQNDTTNPYRRAAASDSWLDQDVDDNDTTLIVRTDTMPLWGTTAGKPGNFPIDVEMGGEVITVSGITGLVEDAFGRTSVSSFGTADVGGAYTLSGGSASDFAVSSGLGRITGSGSANVQRLAYLTGQQAFDFDAYFTSAVSATATGSQLVAQLHARLASPGNGYRFEVFYDPSGRVDIRIVSTVSFSMTQIGVTAANVCLYSPGTLVRTRCQCVGTLLRMKTWLASNPEPQAWQVSGTSTAYISYGYFGLGAWRTPGNTNVNPETRFDNLAVVNPQRFTVDQRSVNSVVKEHDAETFVQVKNRFYAAL